MDDQARRRLIRRGLALIDGAQGWDAVLPASRSILQRMLSELDLPPAQRKIDGRALMPILTADPAFMHDPLAGELIEIAAQLS